MPAVAAVILAHQGNWDEMLMVAIPIAVFAWILHRANKRADEIQAERRTDTAERQARPTDEPQV